MDLSGNGTPKNPSRRKFFRTLGRGVAGVSTVSLVSILGYKSCTDKNTVAAPDPGSAEGVASMDVERARKELADAITGDQGVLTNTLGCDVKWEEDANGNPKPNGWEGYKNENGELIDRNVIKVTVKSEKDRGMANSYMEKLKQWRGIGTLVTNMSDQTNVMAYPWVSTLGIPMTSVNKIKYEESKLNGKLYMRISGVYGNGLLRSTEFPETIRTKKQDHKADMSAITNAEFRENVTEVEDHLKSYIDYMIQSSQFLNGKDAAKNVVKVMAPLMFNRDKDNPKGMIVDFDVDVYIPDKVDRHLPENKTVQMEVQQLERFDAELGMIEKARAQGEKKKTIRIRCNIGNGNIEYDSNPDGFNDQYDAFIKSLALKL